MASAFYSRQRKPEAFKNFYDEVVKSAEKIGLGKPQLPRSRRAPWKQSPSVHVTLDYYRQIYFEACDLLNVARSVISKYPFMSSPAGTPYVSYINVHLNYY